MAILERRKATRRSEYVFASPGGTPYGERTIEDWVVEARLHWGDATGSAGLLEGAELVVFHHCRHTFAKWSLLLGDPATLVMEYGGWLSFDVFKGYAKANAAMVEQSRLNKNRTIREAIDAVAGRSVAPQRRSAQRSRPRFERKEREGGSE
jgi:hypothetical protein